MTKSFVSRAAAVTAGACFLITVGCITGPLGQGSGKVFVQKSEQNKEVIVASNSEKDVFFPVPFAGTPEVTVTDDWMHNLRIIECKPDHFRVRNESYTTVRVGWTATGERAAPTGNPPAAQ